MNTDLSALYLDVLKDRLYTFAPNHPARRSAADRTVADCGGAFYAVDCADPELYGG